MPFNNKIEALWVIDSESGEELLINLKTNEIIAKRINNRIVDPGDKSVNNSSLD